VGAISGIEVGDTLWLKFDPQQMAAIEA